MNKKMKYIIGVVVLVLIIVLGVVMCHKEGNKEDDTSVEGGLQVEEVGGDSEEDSIDFEDFISDDDDSTEGSNTDGSTTNNNNSTGTGNNSNSNDSNDKEEEKEEDKDDDVEKDTGAFGPLF